MSQQDDGIMEDLRIQRRQDRWNRLGKKASPVAAAHLVHQGKPVDCYEDMATEYANRLELQPTDRVLEVGCGSGCLLMQIKERVEEVVGTDFASGMLEHLQGTGVEVHCCEARELPFPDGHFDKVYSHGVIQYFPDEEYARQSVREMLRVCRPGGRILIGSVINGLLKDDYKRSGNRDNYPGMWRLWRVAKELVMQPMYNYYRYGQSVKQELLYLSPFFFKEFFKETPHRWAPLLETVESKPMPYLRYRFDIVAVKDGAEARPLFGRTA